MVYIKNAHHLKNENRGGKLDLGQGRYEKFHENFLRKISLCSSSLKRFSVSFVIFFFLSLWMMGWDDGSYNTRHTHFNKYYVTQWGNYTEGNENKFLIFNIKTIGLSFCFCGTRDRYITLWWLQFCSVQNNKHYFFIAQFNHLYSNNSREEKNHIQIPKK